MLPTLDTLATRANVTKAIFFALFNQKKIYNWCYQPLFIKIGKWALLQLHKRYSIPAIAEVTKNLTQQYIGPFRIMEKVGWPAYKLNVPPDWRIHPIFLVAQLEPVPPPAKDLFARLFLSNLLLIFVKGNANRLKSIKIKKFLNKR